MYLYCKGNQHTMCPYLRLLYEQLRTFFCYNNIYMCSRVDMYIGGVDHGHCDRNQHEEAIL